MSHRLELIFGNNNRLRYVAEQPMVHLTEALVGNDTLLKCDLIQADLVDVTKLVVEHDHTLSSAPTVVAIRRLAGSTTSVPLSTTVTATNYSFYNVPGSNDFDYMFLAITGIPPAGTNWEFDLGNSTPGFSLTVTVKRKT